MLLTILIPTIGRVEFLSHTLNTFINSIRVANLEKNTVEILVMDNFSKDGTAEMVQKLALEYDFIRYKKHEQYYPSAEESLFNGFPFANGEYVWSYGDDDFVSPHAISKVVQTLQTHNPDFFLINTKLFDGPLNAMHTTVQDGTYIYNKAQNIFHDFGFASITTCFSCLCFKKANVSIPLFYETMAVSHIYSYAFSLYIMMYNKKGVFLSVEPLLHQRLNKSSVECERIQSFNIKQNNLPNHAWHIGLMDLIEFTSKKTGQDLQDFYNLYELCRQYTHSKIWMLKVSMCDFIAINIIQDIKKLLIKRFCGNIASNTEIVKKFIAVCQIAKKNANRQYLTHLEEVLQELQKFQIKREKLSKYIPKFVDLLMCRIFYLFKRKEIKRIRYIVENEIRTHVPSMISNNDKHSEQVVYHANDVSDSIYTYLRNDEFKNL